MIAHQWQYFYINAVYMECNWILIQQDIITLHLKKATLTSKFHKATTELVAFYSPF